jgi:hypothetical protein
MSENSDHSKTYTVVGELVIIANAIDHLLNLVLMRPSASKRVRCSNLSSQRSNRGKKWKC